MDSRKMRAEYLHKAYLQYLEALEEFEKKGIKCIQVGVEKTVDIQTGKIKEVDELILNEIPKILKQCITFCEEELKKHYNKLSPL